MRPLLLRSGHRPRRRRRLSDGRTKAARLAKIKGVIMGVCKSPELTSSDRMEIFLQRIATSAAMIIPLIITTSTALGLMVLSGIGRIAKAVALSAAGKTGQGQFMQPSYLLAFSLVNSAGKRSLWMNFTQTDVLQMELGSTERAVNHAFLRLSKVISPQYTRGKPAKDQHHPMHLSRESSTMQQGASNVLGLTSILDILSKFLKSSPVAAQFLGSK